MSGDVTVQVTGAFFTEDKTTVIRIMLSDAIRDLSQEAEKRVQAQLKPGHGVLTGNYRNSIKTTYRNPLESVTNDQGNWWQGPWLEGVSKRNQSSRFKGFHMFRRVRAQIRYLAKKAGEDTATKITIRLNR